MQASRITPTPDSLAYQGKPAPQRHLPITMTIRTSEHRDRPSVRLSLRAHAPRELGREPVTTAPIVAVAA
jgi:hypothetical protein